MLARISGYLAFAPPFLSVFLRGFARGRFESFGLCAWFVCGVVGAFDPLPFVCFSAFLAVAIEFGVDALMFGGKNWILFWMFEALALSAI